MGESSEIVKPSLCAAQSSVRLSSGHGFFVSTYYYCWWRINHRLKTLLLLLVLLIGIRNPVRLNATLIPCNVS